MSRSGLVHYDSINNEWYDVPEEPRVWDAQIKRWVPKEKPPEHTSEGPKEENEFGEISP